MLKKVGGGLQFIVFFFFFTIYSTPPSILSLTSTQAGLRPNPHSGWPLGPRPLASSELSYKALYYSMHNISKLWEPILPGLGTAHASWPLAKSAHKLAIRPLALGQINPIVCSLACRWRLQLALRAD